MASKRDAEETPHWADAKRFKQSAATLGPFSADDEGVGLITPPASPSSMVAEQIRLCYQPQTRSLRNATVVTLAGSGPAVSNNCRRLENILGRWQELDVVIQKSHRATLRQITSAVSSPQFPAASVDHY